MKDNSSANMGYAYSKLRLRESDVTPTDEILEQTLGGSYAAYEAFQGALPRLDIEQEWQWYIKLKKLGFKGFKIFFRRVFFRRHS